MSSRTLHAADLGHSTERAAWQPGVEAWLRLSLVEQFGRVTCEQLPDELLELLPED